MNEDAIGDIFYFKTTKELHQRCKVLNHQDQ